MDNAVQDFTSDDGFFCHLLPGNSVEEGKAFYEKFIGNMPHFNTFFYLGPNATEQWQKYSQFGITEDGQPTVSFFTFNFYKVVSRNLTVLMNYHSPDENYYRHVLEAYNSKPPKGLK